MVIAFSWCMRQWWELNWISKSPDGTNFIEELNTDLLVQILSRWMQKQRVIFLKVDQDSSHMAWRSRTRSSVESIKKGLTMAVCRNHLHKYDNQTEGLLSISNRLITHLSDICAALLHTWKMDWLQHLKKKIKSVKCRPKCAYLCI